MTNTLRLGLVKAASCLALVAMTGACGLFGGGHGGGNQTDGRQCNTGGDNLWQSTRMVIKLIAPDPYSSIFPCPYVVKAVGDSAFFAGFIDAPPGVIQIPGSYGDVVLWIYDSNQINVFAGNAAFLSYSPDSSTNGQPWDRAVIGGKYPGGRGNPIKDTLLVRVSTSSGNAWAGASMPGNISTVSHTVTAPTDLTVGSVGTFRVKPDWDTTSYLYKWKVNGQTVDGARYATFTTSFPTQALNTVQSFVYRADSTVDSVTKTVDTRLRVTVTGPTSVASPGGVCQYVANRFGGNGAVTFAWTKDGVPDGGNSANYAAEFGGTTMNHLITARVTDQSGITTSYGLTVRVSSTGTSHCAL